MKTSITMVDEYELKQKMFNDMKKDISEIVFSHPIFDAICDHIIRKGWRKPEHLQGTDKML